MGKPLHTWLCTNRTSGGNESAVLRELGQVLADAAHAPQRIIEIASEAVPDRSALEAAGVDLLVVFAGDGTINAVAGACEGWGGKVLILPGGTANLLSHALHGDRDPLQIVEALDSARVVRRTCIRNGARTALIEALAGPGATWSDVREDLREGDLAMAASDSLTAIRESTVGPMVGLVEPAGLGREDGYAGLRLEPSDEGLRIEGYGAETIGDYLLQGIALLRRDFRSGPHDDIAVVPQVVCRSLGPAPVELMIDGERYTGESEERFVLDQLDLNLLSTGA